MGLPRGIPGGHTIGQNVLQIVLNLLEFGMDMQQATGTPKITFIDPDMIDKGIPEETFEGQRQLSKEKEYTQCQPANAIILQHLYAVLVARPPQYPPGLNKPGQQSQHQD